MEASRGYSSPLFDVYLRLRPNSNPTAERFLDGDNTHVTIKPPTSDHRKRAVERFAFTKVFDESTSQRDVFDGTSLLQLIQGVLGAEGKVAKDGLLATLGVTGSGKVCIPWSLELNSKFAHTLRRATRFLGPGRNAG